MNYGILRRVGTLVVAAMALSPALAASRLPAHAGAAYAPLHRSVHFTGHMFYQDSTRVPSATVYVLPYGATDTEQAYESFTASQGYYRTPNAFNTYQGYTIYIVCTDQYGNQYSYADDFRPHPSYSYNEFAGNAYMQPDDSGSYNGDN